MNFIMELIMGFFYGAIFGAVFFGVLGAVINVVDKKKHGHLDYRPTYLTEKKKKTYK